MFSDEQLRQHIRELQQFLFGISHYNVRIPVIFRMEYTARKPRELSKYFNRNMG